MIFQTAPNSALSTNGRYVIRMEGGKLESAVPISDKAFVIDPTKPAQLAEMLRASISFDILQSEEVCYAITQLYDRLNPRPSN